MIYFVLAPVTQPAQTLPTAPLPMGHDTYRRRMSHYLRPSPPPPTPPERPPSPPNSFTFDFESSPTSGWTTGTSHTDPVGWTWNVFGETLSLGTGPTSGYGGSGNYYFTETSAPRVAGDTFVLAYDGSHCASSYGGEVSGVNFFYNMYGASMGTLQLVDRGGNVHFSKTGNQGQGWYEASVSFYSATFRFVYTMTQSDYTGDAAVDAVTVVCGHAPPSPPLPPPALPMSPPSSPPTPPTTPPTPPPAPPSGELTLSGESPTLHFGDDISLKRDSSSLLVCSGDIKANDIKVAGKSHSVGELITAFEQLESKVRDLSRVVPGHDASAPPARPPMFYRGWTQGERLPCAGSFCSWRLGGDGRAASWWMETNGRVASRGGWGYASHAATLESCSDHCAAANCNAFSYVPGSEYALFPGNFQSDECLSNPDMQLNRCTILFAPGVRPSAWQKYDGWLGYYQKCAQVLYVSDPTGELGAARSGSGRAESGSGEVGSGSGEAGSGPSDVTDPSDGDLPRTFNWLGIFDAVSELFT